MRVLLKVPAAYFVTAGVVALVSAASAKAPRPPANPFVDVPPLAVRSAGHSIRARLLGGSWTTPSGALVSTTPPCCLRSGRRQTLSLGPGGSVVIVLRESVSQVRAYPMTGRKKTSFLKVTRDKSDALRWHLRAPSLRKNVAATETNVEVPYARGTVYYRFALRARD